MVDLSRHSAIICTNQPNVLDAIRQVLKKSGVEIVSAQVSADLCIESLAAKDQAWLILDWGIGEADAIRILQSIQASHRAGVRPVFLFSRTEVEGLEGVAIEFGVMQMHVGELSRDVIMERLENLATQQVLSKEVAPYVSEMVHAKKSQDFARLRKTLLELNQKKPLDPFIVGELADDYLRSGQLDEAIVLLKPLTDQAFKNPRLLNILGRCLMRKGLFEDATVILQQADLINPYNVKRLLRLGEAYLQIDNPARAEGTFKRALKLDPSSKPAKVGAAKSMLLGGDINEALGLIRQLSGDEEMASVFNMSAVLLIRAGRHEDGMSLYRTACKTIGKQNAPILAKLGFNMGLACYRLKALELAHYYFVISTKLDETYERARHAAAVLTKTVGEGSALTFGMDPDPLKALLKEDGTKVPDALEGLDMKIGGESKPMDYDMDF